MAKTQKQSTRLCRLVIGPANSYGGMILPANVPPRGRKADTIRLESGASQNLAGSYTVRELAVEGCGSEFLEPQMAVDVHIVSIQVVIVFQPSSPLYMRVPA